MSSEDDLIGESIGNYKLTKLLGKGGMGSVYLGEHPRIDRKVAVKVLAPYVVQQPLAAKRFEAEAKVISRIDHPNIIEIYDFGSLESGSLYYVMEMLRGHELRKLMKKKKMSAAAVLPYLEQICAALQAAHDMGVVHRDLKPENIFVLERKPLTIKVLDFGVAKLLETDQGIELTAAGVVVGTPLFVSPEQAAGEPHRIGPGTDIYSLGVLLYWMLAGRPPFIASGPGMLMAMHIKDPAPPLRDKVPELQEGVAEVVHRCLEKAPEDRPGSAQEVYEAYKAGVETAAVAGAVLGFSQDGVAVPLESGETPPPADSLPAGGVVTTTGGGGAQQAVTTMGGANGEVNTTLNVSSDKSRTALWIGLGAVLAAAAVAGVVLLTGSGGPAPAALPAAASPSVVSASPPAVAKKGPAAPAPASEATSPAAVKRTLRISVKGAAAQCRLDTGEGEPRPMPAPCTYESISGKQVPVEVRSKGVAIFSRTWDASKDLTLKLTLDASSRRLVEVPAAVAAAARKASAPKKKRPRKRRPRKKRRKKPGQTAPIGEGTMEVF